MTFAEKKAACRNYFFGLAEKLKDTHVLVQSTGDKGTWYLVPKGTEDQITWYGKPQDSYRYSTLWNWYANLKKCSDPYWVQCYCPDMPRVKKRSDEEHGTKPVFGICVAYYGEDETYHHIFGEKFDRVNKKWSFE